MQLDIVYSLWSIKPCIEFLVFLYRAFRNPASGHRPSRGQLQTAIQDLLIGYRHGFWCWINWGYRRLMYVLDICASKAQHDVLEAHFVTGIRNYIKNKSLVYKIYVIFVGSYERDLECKC